MRFAFLAGRVKKLQRIDKLIFYYSLVIEGLVSGLSGRTSLLGFNRVGSMPDHRTPGSLDAVDPACGERSRNYNYILGPLANLFYIREYYLQVVCLNTFLFVS